MGFTFNYELLGANLIFTVFLLVLARINHSCNTIRYRIFKMGLCLMVCNQLFDIFRARIIWDGIVYPQPMVYVIFVGYYLTAATVMILIVIYMLLQFPKFAANTQRVYTIFFVCEFTVTLLILTTNFTGFMYEIQQDRIVLGVADRVFFFARLAVLIGFLVLLPAYRKLLAPKLFQNWIVTLILAVAVHILPFLINGSDFFQFFANMFLAAAFCLFYSGSYEEGTARMGADMYRSELDYQFGRKEDFYILEIQLRNYDWLVERHRYTEEELDGLYGMLAFKLKGERRVMLFQKSPSCIGVIAVNMSQREAEQLAGRLREWMRELFGGKLIFAVTAAKCPQYADNAVDAERMLHFLQHKCPKNNYYFCDESDDSEFCERDDILILLHSMHLEKQDVVLFGRPIISRSSSRVQNFEILCRLQLAGSGIIHSEHVIRLAEQYGYIHDVNMVVLKNVCDFLSTAVAIREKLRVSLHVSSEELEKAGFAEDVLEIIKDYDLAPGVLNFEVTMIQGESDIIRMRDVMATLCEYQIGFTLTDFDPSSVNFESITLLPFDSIKFGRFCAKRALENKETYDVIGLLVDLFKERGYAIVFKGIDNDELENVAISLGTDYLQGDKYEKPFPVERIEEQLDLQIMF